MTYNRDIGNCEHCKKQFGYALIHNGFNDSSYAYCDTCGTTCILDGWKAPKGVELKLQTEISEDVEKLLVLCNCGGHFRKGASPRCPHCQELLSAEIATKWIEANAQGFKQGWRWPKSWSGLYCIVIENKVITDNWK